MKKKLRTLKLTSKYSFGVREKKKLK